MSFFDEAVSTAKTVGKTVGKQTEKILLISKKKLIAIELENKLEKHYEDLGKMYYAVLRAEEPTDKNPVEIVDEVDRVAAELEEIREEIRALSNK